MFKLERTNSEVGGQASLEKKTPIQLAAETVKVHRVTLNQVKACATDAFAEYKYEYRLRVLSHQSLI